MLLRAMVHRRKSSRPQMPPIKKQMIGSFQFGRNARANSQVDAPPAMNASTRTNANASTPAATASSSPATIGWSL